MFAPICSHFCAFVVVNDSKTRGSTYFTTNETYTIKHEETSLQQYKTLLFTRNRDVSNLMCFVKIV